MNFWTEERIETLRTLVNCGLTATQVSRQMGTTRNAVIGKASREGFQWCRAANCHYTPDEIRERNTRRMAICRRKVARFVCVPTTEPEPQGDVPTGCRWLHGEANERNFCGSPTDTSWCPFHRAIVFSRATVNEREAA